MDWVGEQMEMKSLNEWYDMTYDRMVYYGGGALVKKYNSMFNLLKAIYPEHNWSLRQYKAKIPISKQQFHLFKTAKKLFPSEDIKLSYRHPSLLFENKVKMERRRLVHFFSGTRVSRSSAL